MSISLGTGTYITGGLLLYLDASNTASTSDPTLWKDLSGLSNNMTKGGAPTLTTIGSVSCFRFTAAGQYFRNAAMTGFMPTSDLTFDCWIYPEADVQADDRACLFQLSGGQSAYHSYNKSNLKLSNYWYSHPPEGYHETGSAPGRNVWQRLGAVWNYSSGTLTQWTNNTPTSTATLGIASAGNIGTIGYEPTPAYRQFAGGMAIMMVYNRALTDLEMQQNYSAFAPRFSGGALITAGSGITFNDTTTQISKFDSTMDHGTLLSMTSYTTAGSYTWSKPSGCTKIIVRVVGGGGGAAGYCESGGSGAYSERTIDVTNITSVAVTVGGGGTAIAYYNAAGDGGTSSFGAYASATGGYGANRNYSHTGGVGGTASSGDINLYGGSGTGHGNSMGTGAPAKGGDSYWGGSAGTNRNAGTGKVGPGAPGTGGPGNRTNDGGSAGGTGAAGAVVVWEYK